MVVFKVWEYKCKSEIEKNRENKRSYKRRKENTLNLLNKEKYKNMKYNKKIRIRVTNKVLRVRKIYVWFYINSSDFTTKY
jgi:hypothetical protein